MSHQLQPLMSIPECLTVESRAMTSSQPTIATPPSLTLDLFVVPQCLASKFATLNLFRVVKKYTNSKSNNKYNYPRTQTEHRQNLLIQSPSPKSGFSDKTRSKFDASSRSGSSSSVELKLTITPMSCTTRRCSSAFSQWQCPLPECSKNLAPQLREVGSILLNDIVCFQLKFEQSDAVATMHTFLQCMYNHEIFDPIFKEIAKTNSTIYDQLLEDFQGKWRFACFNYATGSNNLELQASDCSENDESFYKAIDEPGRLVSSLDVTNPQTLFINGDRYCGTFTETELEVAICASARLLSTFKSYESSLRMTDDAAWTVNANIRRSEKCAKTWWDEDLVENNTVPIEVTNSYCLEPVNIFFSNGVTILVVLFVVLCFGYLACIFTTRYRMNRMIYLQRTREDNLQRARDANMQRMRRILALFAENQSILAQQNLEANSLTRFSNKSFDEIRAFLQQHLLQKIYIQKIKSNESSFASTLSDGTVSDDTNLQPNITTNDIKIANNLLIDEATNLHATQIPSTAVTNNVDVNDSVANELHASYVTSEMLEGAEATEVDDVIVCLICLEEMKGGDIYYQLECNHIFHWDCLIQWLKKKCQCPVCRVTFTFKEIEAKDGEMNNDQESRNRTSQSYLSTQQSPEDFRTEAQIINDETNIEMTPLRRETQDNNNETITEMTSLATQQPSSSNNRNVVTS